MDKVSKIRKNLNYINKAILFALFFSIKLNCFSSQKNDAVLFLKNPPQRIFIERGNYASYAGSFDSIKPENNNSFIIDMNLLESNSIIKIHIQTNDEYLVFPVFINGIEKIQKIGIEINPKFESHIWFSNNHNDNKLLSLFIETNKKYLYTPLFLILDKNNHLIFQGDNPIELRNCLINMKIES